MTNRRTFIKQMSSASLGLAFTPIMFNPEKKLRVALVGLGRYAGYLAEGIQASKYCELKGIVTGTPEKEISWAKKYGIAKKDIYNYRNFDTIAQNPDIDLIYIVLPNAMHAEYAIRAANAKKHVIVEKPMAISVKECEQIMAACKKNKVQLAVGYRLHFEPYNMEMKRLGQEKVFGEVRYVDASLGYGINFENPNDWHIKKALSGGGPLTNLGVYCIQAARYITGKEPVSVTAQFSPITRPDLFKEVEEALTWQMRFDSKTVATCSSSYSYGIDRLYASAEDGFFELSPAISYGPFVGKTSKGPLSFPEIDQQQTQMDAIATYILDNKPLPEHISGIEGLLDVKIIEAVYKAAESGKEVKV